MKRIDGVSHISGGRHLTAIAFLLMLTSCVAVGPDYVRPDADVADAWADGKDSRVRQEPEDIGRWWEAFEDPKLAALIDSAVAQNLDLQTIGVRILESRARLGIAVGNQYPQRQALSGGYSRNNLSRNAPNSAGADKAFGFYNLGLDVAWEVDFWGKFSRGIESASAELDADLAAYDDFLVSLIAEVAATYVRMRTLQERVALARSNVAIQERGQNIAKVRFQAEDVTELDFSQATALLRDTKARIPDLEAGIRQAQNALAVLLGRPPGDLSVEFGGPAKIPDWPQQVAIGVPGDLLRRRPDIRRAERLAAAQSERIGIAEADLYPSFSLFGSIGLETGDSGNLQTRGADIADLFEGDAVTSVIGGGFDWPIFNYGRLKNNVRVQDARFQQLVLQYQNSVLRAAREVEDALVGYLKGQESVRELQASVKASQRSVALSEIQYQNGLTDYTRVLDTQEFLTFEQDRLAAAQGAVALNLVFLYKALGGGWESHLSSQVVPEEVRNAMRERTDWDALIPPAGSQEADAVPANMEQSR